MSSASVCSFLDGHLTLQILNFFIEKEIYPKEEVIKSKVSILQKTKLFSEIRKYSPADYDETKVKETEDLLKKFESDYQKTPSEKADQLLLLDYSKLAYETGNYQKSYDLLVHYKKVTTDNEKLLGTFWGRFASCLMLKDYTKAFQEYQLLKDAIETTDEDDFNHRTWLLNWSLFLFFNLPNGKDLLVDLYMTERNMDMIHTNSTHLLRYLAVVSVLGYKMREIKELVRILNKKNTLFKNNAVLNFIEELYVNVDIEKAISKIEDCEKELKTDYFLHSLTDEFLKKAKQLVFETNCRIFNTTDISEFVGKLKVSQNGEEFAKEVIEKAQLNAKVESGKVHIHFTASKINELMKEKKELIATKTLEIEEFLKNKKK